MTFLILSRTGESDAIPITKLLDITVTRGIQKDRNITEVLEGKFGRRIQLQTGHRGRWHEICKGIYLRS